MKINIENYENMTPEEKLAALEAYDPEKDGFVSKTLFDKTKNSLMLLAYPTAVLSFLFALNHLSYELSYMGIILSFAVAIFAVFSDKWP